MNNNYYLWYFFFLDSKPTRLIVMPLDRDPREQSVSKTHAALLLAFLRDKWKNHGFVQSSSRTLQQCHLYDSALFVQERRR